MLALSIRQPWAWMILHAGKDIENRQWPTRVRGRVLIHAAKGMTRGEFFDGMAISSICILQGRADVRPRWLPRIDEVPRGGIVGSVEIVDCFNRSGSPWFFGRYGFVLRDPRPLPFVPFKGSLGFFEVPDDLVSMVTSSPATPASDQVGL